MENTKTSLFDVTHWTEKRPPPPGTKVFLGEFETGPFTVKDIDGYGALSFWDRKQGWKLWPSESASLCFTKIKKEPPKPDKQYERLFI